MIKINIKKIIYIRYMKQFKDNELLSLKYNQIDILERDDNKEVYFGERKEDNKK